MILSRSDAYDAPIFSTFILLEKDLKYHLEGLLRDSSRFNANDVLVHLPPDHPGIFEVEHGGPVSVAQFPPAILRETVKMQKESGINPLCMVHGTVDIPLGNRNITSPAWLIPLSYRYDKISRLYQFTPNEDDRFLNPWLRHRLEELGIQPESTESDPFFSLLSSKGLGCNPELYCIGNFHHHRYQVIRELEEILLLERPQAQIHRLFGFDDERRDEVLQLASGKLYSSDTDHARVFQDFPEKNCVVQGPPGTGKSQVLTNCVSKAMASGYRTLMVSEKRAALEVIYKKLAQFGLDKLAFIATTDQLSHDFLQELKRTWEYFDTLQHSSVRNLLLSEQYLDNLQMTLDLLAQTELIGGVSFHVFMEVASGMKPGNFPYAGDTFSVRHFLDTEQDLQTLFESGISTVLHRLRPEIFSDERLLKLDVTIRALTEELEDLRHRFGVETPEDISRIMRRAALCQVLENELYKQHAPLFRVNSKARKRFLKLRKEYLKLRAETESPESDLSHWKIVPSKEEAESLLTRLEKGGWLERRKARSRWNQLAHLPVQNAVEALKAHLVRCAQSEALSHIIVEFCELGIDTPAIQVETLYGAMHLYAEAQWLELEAIPLEEREQLTGQHARFYAVHQELRNTFQFEDRTPVLQQLGLLQQKLPDLIRYRALLPQFSATELKAIGRNPDFFQLKGEVLRSHWVRFQERFPEFSSFQLADLHRKVDAVLTAEQEESHLFAREIEQQVKQRFDAYHQLLNTPAHKLSAEEKALKIQLRRGKALLVKEFGKSRSHPTLRELYHSDALPWIQLLKPVWLSNPVQLAKCFPMETGLFDIAIFDEASQIPLQHALGALQRSRRSLIAGDDQQMGPSSYFRSGPSEPIDLLHQANYQWHRIELRHHYRGSHPDLIRFSNLHFYNNQLRAYPAAHAQSPLHFHFVADATYIDRRNSDEAKAVAGTVHELLKISDSVGVVAFSEEQLACIREQLTDADLRKIQDETFPGFFKALENVQGDECDHLVISFGYGKSEEGDFPLRFGPMNTANGRKRLNVLLTRSRESLHFFASVRSTDFALSENESINLLRNWFRFIEVHQGTATLEFPYGLEPEITNDTLTFRRIQETLPQAQELVTLQSVLENRGWKVTYR